MKKILFISPHFPPSNLAAVHRTRLFVQHLPSFDWEPIVLTVNEKYYEEQHDWNLVKLVSKKLRVEKVNAIRLTRPRFIGDIGLRAFFQLYKKAKELITSEKIDFLFIPVPSFYVALLGRWLHNATGIKYGIDYIDPWVHEFPGSTRIFSRHWFSTKLSEFLEPIAVKNASLITGVAEGYYSDVLRRNPRLGKIVISGAMPYGGEIMDHAMVNSLDIEPSLLKKKPGKLQLVYAGAMLPKAYGPLEKIFKCIADNHPVFSKTEFHFIGTGKTPGDANGFNIKPLAQKYGLWKTNVYEYPQRIPYLDVLVHLNNADGIFILGSTEPHYTPSKVYQGVLSGKPIFAVLHSKSTALRAINNSGAGVVLDFDGENELDKIYNDFCKRFLEYKESMSLFKPVNTDAEEFRNYSAKNVTKTLAVLLDKIVKAD